MTLNGLIRLAITILRVSSIVFRAVVLRSRVVYALYISSSIELHLQLAFK